MNTLIKIILGLILVTGCTTPIEAEDNMNARLQPPLKKLGWGLSGELTPGSIARVFSIQKSFAEASLFTVQLGIRNPNITNIVANEIIKARADISWRINGNIITRTVDCNNGIAVSGSAESVSVRVTDESIITVANKVPYDVTAIIAPGTRPSVQQPPIYTGERVRLGPVGGSSIPVPDGAISALITVAPVVIGPTINFNYHIARQIGNGGNVLKAYMPVITDGWIPLANGCTSIAFEQGALAADDYYYFTTFGIDG